MTLAPRGTPLYETTYGNIAPRIGLAYQFGGIRNWDAALRAGFGVFYDLGQGSLGGVSSFFPYIADKNFSLSPFPLSPQDAAPPRTHYKSARCNNARRRSSSETSADISVECRARAVDWKQSELSATYVGAIGRQLLRVTNLFNVNPNFEFIALTDNSATSDYNALQVKFQRRLSRGLQALGSYSWSHSIDIASTDAIATNINTPGQIADANVDRGNSNFDIRHAFTAGVTYELPSPGSQKTVKAILSGWSIDSFFFARSAPPVNIVGGSFFAAGTQLAPRPNINPGVPLEIHGSQFPGGKIFNRAAFSRSACRNSG